MKDKAKNFDLAKKIGMTLDSDEEKTEETAEEITAGVAEEISEIKEDTQE